MRVVVIQGLLTQKIWASDLPCFSQLFCFGFALSLVPYYLLLQAPVIFEPRSFYFFLFTVWKNNLCCNDDPDRGVILSVAKVIGFRFLQMLWNCSVVYNVPFIFLINVSWVCPWLACHFFLTPWRNFFPHRRDSTLFLSSDFLSSVSN